MDKEIFKEIPNYEGKYEVSNFGRVKSLNYKLKKIDGILKPFVDKEGYKTVVLCNKIKNKCLKIHRLVALTFLPNPKNKSQVNHIDGNKSNNHIDNLEWTTQSENVKHSFDVLGVKSFWIGKIGTNFPTTKLKTGYDASGFTKSKYAHSQNPVDRFDCNGCYIDSFSSAREAERVTGTDGSSISKACRSVRGYKTAGGYIWKYKT